MNITMLQTIASSRVQELQRDSRDCRQAAQARQPRPARSAPRRGGGLRAERATGMRSRVGYTLVEGRPAPRGDQRPAPLMSSRPAPVRPRAGVRQPARGRQGKGIRSGSTHPVRAGAEASTAGL